MCPKLRVAQCLFEDVDLPTQGVPVARVAAGNRFYEHHPVTRGLQRRGWYSIVAFAYAAHLLWLVACSVLLWLLTRGAAPSARGLADWVLASLLSWLLDAAVVQPLRLLLLWGLLTPRGTPTPQGLQDLPPLSPKFAGSPTLTDAKRADTGLSASTAFAPALR